MSTSSLPMGSIPTGVGKPNTITHVWPGVRVYPHRCGETAVGRFGLSDTSGLSPQVWGNLPECPSRFCVLRSIPTGVGKPLNGNLLKKLNFKRTVRDTQHSLPRLCTQQNYKSNFAIFAISSVISADFVVSAAFAQVR